jgi:hypothetical protein
VYLFTFLSKLNPNSKQAADFSGIGGAYINCWIQFKDYEAAEQLAKLLIRKQGWIPEKKTAASIVQKRSCKKRTDQQYYSEAIKYGYTLVFNTWPKDAADARHDYEAEESDR